MLYYTDRKDARPLSAYRRDYVLVPRPPRHYPRTEFPRIFMLVVATVTKRTAPGPGAGRSIQGSGKPILRICPTAAFPSCSDRRRAAKTSHCPGKSYCIVIIIFTVVLIVLCVLIFFISIA